VIREAKAEDKACASSWIEWGSAKFGQPAAQVTEAPRIRSIAELIPHGSTYTECDGVPRIRVTSYETQWTTQTVDSSLSTKAEEEEAPTCNVLDQRACDDNWEGLGEIMVESDFRQAMELRNWNTTKDRTPNVRARRFFGCDPPLDICQSLQQKLRISGKDACAVRAGHFALVYWPPNLKTRNICGNGGLGEFETASADGASNPPATVTTDVLRFTRAWNKEQGMTILFQSHH
jgi:hypothetical protein